MRVINYTILRGSSSASVRATCSICHGNTLNGLVEENAVEFVFGFMKGLIVFDFTTQHLVTNS